MVVTVEGPEYGRCGDIISQLATLDGVASSSLVYHQIDNESCRRSPYNETVTP